MKSRLRCNTAYYKKLKSLIMDVLFSGDRLEVISRRHRDLDGKKVFLNADDFNFRVSENRFGGQTIFDNDMDDLIDDFLKKILRRTYTTKEPTERKIL